MKVNLIKQEEVEFNLTEDKCERISHKTFRMLTGYQEGTPDNKHPKMVAFKNKDEYQQEAYKYNLDVNSDVLINQKGNIFCYLEGSVVKNNEESADVATDTEESKGE